MAISLAKIRKDYEDNIEIVCPNCDSTQYSLDKSDVGLHECLQCNEAFKIAESISSDYVDLSSINDAISSFETQIENLTTRIKRLEKELGIGKK